MGMRRVSNMIGKSSRPPGARSVPRAPAIAPLQRRVEAALKDGRPAHALELAKQYAVQKPGPESRALLRRSYLAAAAVHVARDSFRDAHAVLTEAEKLSPDDPTWWERLAELRAELGDHTRAVQLLEKATGPTARARVLGRVADRALRDGDTGKSLLPADLHPQFDLIRKAFAEYERGRDDQARETLNGVGLASPFLEWKVLLRGLIAWSSGDTPRAMENWSRLSPDRLPARIAAPFRLSVDKSFAGTLAGDELPAVSRQAERLAGGLYEGLRRLRRQLGSEESLPQALESARALVPELKRTAPHLVPRLGHVFYWAIVAGGQPEDLPRYSKVFGPPPDDPQFWRLQAMVMEQVRRLDAAHAFWGKYEEWIARTPARWPGAQAARARALVLERMGRIAREWLADEGADEFEEFGDFLDFFERDGRRRPKPRKPLSPSAEECFRRAADLAPDWVVPATELLREYERTPARALAAVEKLLQRFPAELDLLEEAARLYESAGETAKARHCLKQALSANPLDRRLRQRAAGLSLNDARRRAEAGEFEEARAALREAAALGEAALGPAVAALAATVEHRAGETETAARHQEAVLAFPDGRLAGTYRLLVERTRLKMKKPELAAHQAAFTEGLSGGGTAGELIALLDALDQYRQEPTHYRGLKTHEKKILDRAAASAKRDLSEDDLVRLGLTLHGLKLWKPLRVLGDEGIVRFAQNAHFCFFQAEAMLARRRSEYVSYMIGMIYSRVKQLLDAASDDRYRRLKELLDERVRETPDVDRWLNARWAW